MLSLTGGRRISNCPAGLPPPCLGLWGQTADKQTTNKPENQQSNEPTDQETNKPTNQQGNKPTPQQATRAEMNPQTNQKTTKKSTKNPPKLLQNRSWGLSWAPLGAAWELLGPSWRQEGHKSRKPIEITTGRPPPGEPSWDQKFIKNWSGGLPKSDHFFDWLWGRVLLPFGPNLVPTWPPKPSPNRPKLAPRSIKNWIKMPTNFLFDF